MKPLKLGEGSLSSRSQSPAMSPHIVSKLWLFPHGCMVEPGDSGAFGGRLEVSGEGSGYSKFYGGSSFLGSFHINLWEGCGRFWKNCPINFLSPGPTYCHCWGYHLSFDVVLSSSLPAAHFYVVLGVTEAQHFHAFSSMKHVEKIKNDNKPCTLAGCLGWKHWENIPKTSGIAIMHEDSTISTQLDPLSHALM